MEMLKLSAFVKKGITFDEKVRLIMDWEEDRGADGEWVYDLDDDCDAWSWKELYDLKTLYKCRAEGRYWMGGWQFACNGLNTKGNSSTAWCITEEKLKDFFTDNNLLGEIADRFEDWMMANERYGEDKAIRDFSNIYGMLIDFKAYRKATESRKYKWVAISSDNAFEEECLGSFDSIEDCYFNMRSFALEKMKWNTEYSDVKECKEEGSFINYDVDFYEDKIVHTSYSGTYMYKIVPSTTIFDDEYKKKFLEEVNDYVRRNDYIRAINIYSQYKDIDKNILVKGHEMAYNGESEWETGMSRSEGVNYVSVFFPNRTNPSYSVDIPIKDIETSELGRIVKTFSIRNRKEWAENK